MENIKVQELTPIQAAEQVIKLETLSKRLDEKLAELREKLLQVTKEQGVLTLKTDAYTITRAKRDTLKISNQESIVKELIDMNVPVLTEVVLTKGSKDILKQLIKDGKEFNSAEVTSTEYISIRITK